jgi:DNA-binding transcriptional LysR family regulator
MTHPEIEAFLTIIKCGSITKAAEILYVTQPALSRRIKSLETELGYSLIMRQKGIRCVELTAAGRAFISVAEKWQALWREAQDIHQLDRNTVLSVASVDSVSSYIMPLVYHSFLQSAPKTNLTIRTLHSYESYQYAENGLVDLAFISDDMYSKNVETIPAFREAMCFVCARGADYPQDVHPSQLDAKKQIKLPWNPEYDVWHEYWFGTTVQPRVFLDKMSLIEQFVCLEDSWAVVPASVANQLKRNIDIEARSIKEGPSDRICYYLLGVNRKPEPTGRFLHLLNDCLKKTEGVSSLLVLD